MSATERYYPSQFQFSLALAGLMLFGNTQLCLGVQEQTPQEAPKSARVDKQLAQLHFHDGSVVGAKFKTESIHVKTEFGMLTVPFERIERLTPGLNSRPEIAKRIKTLIGQLGDSESDTRAAAKNELLSMGAKIQDVLKKFKDDTDANVAKELQQIQVQLASQLANAEIGTESEDQPWIMLDTVATSQFEIVGEIQEREFELTSKFGILNVSLGDIKYATREFAAGKKSIRKSVSVDAMAFFQSKPHNTKIRVKKGDRISIKADGIVQWTNWNSSSSPEGITNRGQWNGINSGKLVARIGTDNSRAVQIGAKADFVAKNSGTLYLGIAMRDSYASNTGYSWVGEYKTKITINSDSSRK